MSYSNEDGFGRFLMMQRVVDMFDGNPNMQRIIQYGLLAQMQHEDEDLEIVDDYDVEWDYSEQKYKLNKKSSRKITYAEFLDMDALGAFRCSSNSDDEESDVEGESQLLEEKKRKNKAERKRLKKQRQKERKQQQKEQKPTQDKETDKVGDKPGNDKTEESLNLKDMAQALESENSNCTSDGSSDDEAEELDLTSSFVTKAAEIAKRQLEQKQESKEKKKSPGKEEQKMPEKPACEESRVEKKDTLMPEPKMEDFVKMSAELASIGNKYATAGKYELAVKYFTDAIKFNPTEYRLFGNRAFVFEKMQDFEKALNDAELSLNMCPGWVKGLFRKGRALAGLKRYEEAAGAFEEVLKVDRSCTEASQELERVQILQLMVNGLTRDQSSKALINYGSVDKGREALAKLKKSEVFPAVPVLPQQVVNVTGLSPVLSAKMAAVAAAAPPPAQDASKNPPEALIPFQSHQTLAKPEAPVPSKSNYVVQAPELFPVWVGNLGFSVTEPLLNNLFNKVGTVYSVKHLPSRRCAFINFTEQQHCDDAIQRYHGYELFGSRLAVRYPDRIPPGLNISKSAHKSTDQQDEYLQSNGYAAGRTGYSKSIYPNRGAYRY